MYEKYTSDAVVLSEYDRGEYDKTFALYTSDFGLVYARASAIRRPQSRMRAALALFAPTSVSLVRGTRGWRLTGARAALYEHLSSEGAHTYARITQLLLRLVRGEEKNKYLFETLLGARRACAASAGVALAAAELLCVARMLYALGYISSGALTTALFTHTKYATDDLTIVHDSRSSVLGAVNKALSESHL